MLSRVFKLKISSINLQGYELDNISLINLISGVPSTFSLNAR